MVPVQQSVMLGVFLDFFQVNRFTDVNRLNQKLVFLVFFFDHKSILTFPPIKNTPYGVFFIARYGLKNLENILSTLAKNPLFADLQFAVPAFHEPPESAQAIIVLATAI